MKKGISLVALVITIVVLVILTGTIILSTMNNNIFDNTNSTVNDYNKKVIIEDVQTKIQTQRLSNVNQGIYKITMEEIIPIIEEHGTFDNNVLKLTTAQGIEIWLYEIMEIPLEEYATITYENSVLTVQTELTSNGYTLQYTIDNGTTWNTYNQAVTVTDESGIMVRLINEEGTVVSNTIKVTQGGNIVVDSQSPTVRITSDTQSPTNASTITYTITFSEPVIDFTIEDITIINGTKETLSGSGSNYILTVTTSASQNDTQTVNIVAGACTDEAGNNNSASNTVSITIDRVAPSATITSNKTRPTNLSTIIYTIQFNENVTGFTAEDITVTNGTKGEFTKVNDREYTIVVTNASVGTQTIAISGGTCMDNVNNSNISVSKDVTIEATTLADLNLTTSNYGTTVTGYSANGFTTWQLLYHQEVDGQMYYYIVPSTQTGGTTLSLYSGDNASGIISNAKKWFGLSAEFDKVTTTNNNYKATIQLLDTTVWNATYKTGNELETYIQDVIGAPTMEMLVESYKAKTGTSLTITANAIGYNDPGDFSGTLYVTGVFYWLASPSSGYVNSANYATGVCVVGNDGTQNGYGTYNWAKCGLRPVVCLKSTCPAYMNGSTIVIGN